MAWCLGTGTVLPLPLLLTTQCSAKYRRYAPVSEQVMGHRQVNRAAVLHRGATICPCLVVTVLEDEFLSIEQLSS